MVLPICWVELAEFCWAEELIVVIEGRGGVILAVSRLCVGWGGGSCWLAAWMDDAPTGLDEYRAVEEVEWSFDGIFCGGGGRGVSLRRWRGGLTSDWSVTRWPIESEESGDANPLGSERIAIGRWISWIGLVPIPLILGLRSKILKLVLELTSTLANNLFTWHIWTVTWPGICVTWSGRNKRRSWTHLTWRLRLTIPLIRLTQTTEKLCYLL